MQCSQVQETRGALSLEKYVVNDDDADGGDEDDNDYDDHHENDDDHHHHRMHDAHLLEDIDTNSSSDSPVKKS